MYAVITTIGGLMAAWNQVIGLLVGGLFATLGLLLVGNRLYWRLCGTRVRGVIVGVRQDDVRYYHEVYRYSLPDGSTHEATGDIGTRANESMRTGREVPLLVFRRHPDAATPVHHYVMDVLGVVFALVGSLIVRFALRTWPVTASTWLSLGLLVLFATIQLYRRLHPQGGAHPPVPPLSGSRSRDWQTSSVRPVEELLDPNELAAQRAQLQRSTRYLRPALPLVGLALIALGVNLSAKLWNLQTHGVSADGHVVSLQRSSSGRSSSYYPVVDCVVLGGETIRFRDHIGSNPALYRPGDLVRVRYLASSPTSSAIIDRGVWNWLLPGGVALFGIGLIAAAVAISRRTQNPTTV
jgi:hypothetical protein